MIMSSNLAMSKTKRGGATYQITTILSSDIGQTLKMTSEPYVSLVSKEMYE